VGEIDGGKRVVSKREVVSPDDRASESCLHCEINDLVQEHIEGRETIEMAEVAARMAESLVDFVLRAPEEKGRNCSPRPLGMSDKRSWKRPGRSKLVQIRRIDLIRGAGTASFSRIRRAKK
jgi:hypothetical protein